MHKGIRMAKTSKEVGIQGEGMACCQAGTSECSLWLKKRGVLTWEGERG